MHAQQIDDYYKAYSGAFFNLLRWHELDAFWEVLRSQADQGWYVYAVGEEPPTSPQSSEGLLTFIEEIDALLRREHQEDYCGIVYVDDKASPSYIKIYDPNNLGAVCGSSGRHVPPGWIISRLRPRTLNELPFLTESRKRWWKRILGVYQD